MPASKSTASGTTLSWWLSEGDEECLHCGQLYIYEREFRCPVCDRASCVHCRVKDAQGVFVCVECVATFDETAQPTDRGGRSLG